MEDHIAYMERQNKINKDAHLREVIDSIDRPIRPLVIEFNRIGLKTQYSCCGFNYDGEEEPKTHTRHAYIFFYEPESEIGKRNFEYVKKYGEFQGWNIWKFCIEKNGKAIWTIQSYLTQGLENLYVKNDGISNAIHDYEIHVLRIGDMINLCSKMESESEDFSIEDGNRIKVAYYPEWQIKPKNNTNLCKKNPWNEKNKAMLDTLMKAIDEGKRCQVTWDNTTNTPKVIEGI